MSSSSDRGHGRLLLDEPAAGVARLTISNPDKRGALDEAILAGFVSTLQGLDARCVVVTGERGNFSAGFDFDALASRLTSGDADGLASDPLAAALESIEHFPYPTLAALDGHALGGGLEVALACDVRLAAAGATFGMPPSKLGVVYSHTGIRRFIETVGPARTRELFLCGRRIDAGTAQAWGLVNWVCEPDALEGEAVGLGAELAAAAPLAQVGNKRVIGAVAAAGGPLSPELERELRELRRAAFASEDLREALHAFTERRPPRWQGR